jgi:hypothetical protein
MDSLFDINKTVSATAYVMKKKGGEISAFFLMKKLYGAERIALTEWHRQITGDSFSSMPKGPVLSRTLNLFNGTIAATNSDMQKWSEHFSPREGNNIKLVKEPDFDYLSDREKDALNRASDEIDTLVKANGVIADVLHQMWPEWTDPSTCGKKSIALTIREVLSEVIEDEDQIQKICLEVESVQSAKASLQV